MFDYILREIIEKNIFWRNINNYLDLMERFEKIIFVDFTFDEF